MTSILYIGMDVHTTNYTLCSYSLETQQPFGRMQVEPDYKQILKYIEKMKEAWGDDIEIVCGYEAGLPGLFTVCWLPSRATWKKPNTGRKELRMYGGMKRLGT